MKVAFNQLMAEVNGNDCTWAALHYRMFGCESPPGYWTTVRDLMLAGFCLLIFSLPVIGQDASWNEIQWSKHLAESIHAEAEYRLQDGSRIDIFQPGVCAWEVEWCSKWEQAFGQAAFYAASTGTTPGIWLLKRGKKDDEDYLRFLTALHFYRSQGLEIKWQVTEVKP